MKKQNNNLMEKIVSLAKRRGFIYPGSEIYGGLAGTWDYGPLGVELRNNIKKEWWRMFVEEEENMFGMDADILMNRKVWEASGHVSGFNEPLVECEKCHKRFREDHVEKECPECKGKLAKAKEFNTMFKTSIGAVQDESSKVYLRPETAAGMFVNFKNIIDSFHPKLPFGMAQIGKAFRNEISPGNFIFRIREFEQMEVEYFVKEEEWGKWFDYWLKKMRGWMDFLGIKNVSEREVDKDERAHYSKRTIDFEYDFPFGKDELYGLAYRTDFDLKAHKLEYHDEETKEKFIPHVIEPSLGMERTILVLLCSAYDEDELGGERRTVLRFNPKMAPIKTAVFPLLANKPQLVKKAREVFEMVKKEVPVSWDDIGNIGKRYRRQDEIGTPFCLTIDFQTLEDNTLTIRDRDTGKQQRLAISEVIEYLKKRLG